MKKYSFQMTKEEVRELCLRIMWERLLLHRSKCLLLAAILALEGIFVSWAAALGLFIFLLLIFTVFAARNFLVMNEQLCKQTRTVTVGDGMLKRDMGEELYSEIPCRSITEIRITRHLLMLGRRQASEAIAWYPIPLRVFADEQERDRFVEYVRNPQAQEDERAAAPGVGEHGAAAATDLGVQPAERPEKEFFSVSSQVGEKEWIRMTAAATENLQAGVLGKQKNYAVWIALAAVVSVLLCGAAWFFPSAADIIYIVSFLGTTVSLILLRNLLESPEKRIRAQILRGMGHNNAWGVWNTSVTERGVRQSTSEKNNILLPWESLLCVVETDTELLFYQKDRIHFGMLPKEGQESREQIELLKELCRENRVEVLGGKRKKYAPNWLFPLLIFVMIAGYLTAYTCLISRDSWKDPVDGYVPLDEQVSVLRSFGFTVSEETEEALGNYMEENGISSYVESYPYTWLLSNLAWVDAADRVRDGMEVFWFDFEGWDISTDYIRVLEGMQGLSKGSILDDVKNIREDTENINWERGTGTITVSLEWSGQEYFWRMDVENDWIDAEVLGIYNGLLEKEGVSERFYMTGDDGQGVFVFYCTGEWALAFEDATGLNLESYTVKKGW